MIDATNASTDAELLAYIDGVLSPVERQGLEAKLADNAELRSRLVELASGSRPFAAAYDVLLKSAPRAELAAALESARAKFAGARSDQRRLTQRQWLRAIAAALVVFI